jgi:hypothetical protein
MKKILLTSISLFIAGGVLIAQQKQKTKRSPKAEQKAAEAKRVAEKQAHYKALQVQSTKIEKAN